MELQEATTTRESTDRALLDGAVRLRWRIEQLEAELLGMVSEIDRRRAFEHDGALSVTAWLGTTCRMDRGRAGDVVRLARAGKAFPELHEAHARGRISSCEVRRIAGGAETVRRDLERTGAPAGKVDQDIEELRHSLLESAEDGEGPRGLRREIGSRRHQLAADAMAFDEWVAFQQRELHFGTTFGGMVEIRGTLDPLSAASVRTAIESLSTTTEQAPELSAGQRRADALVQLAERAMDAGTLPGSRRQRPHIGVTVSETTLRTPPEAPGGEPAELHGHGPASGHTARLLACDGEIRRLVTGADSEVLDVGRATRAVPGGLFRALSLRDGGCARPGCDRPPEWCDAHHLVHWAHGGPTSLDNLVLLCRRHHTEVHLSGPVVPSVPNEPPTTGGFRDPPTVGAEGAPSASHVDD